MYVGTYSAQLSHARAQGEGVDLSSYTSYKYYILLYRIILASRRPCVIMPFHYCSVCACEERIKGRGGIGLTLTRGLTRKIVQGF